MTTAAFRPPDPEAILRGLPDGPLLGHALRFAWTLAFLALNRDGGLRPFGLWVDASGGVQVVVPPAEVTDLLQHLREALAARVAEDGALITIVVDDVWMQAEGLWTEPRDALRARVERPGRGPLCAVHLYEGPAEKGAAQGLAWWFDLTAGPAPTVSWSAEGAVGEC